MTGCASFDKAAQAVIMGTCYSAATVRVSRKQRERSGCCLFALELDARRLLVSYSASSESKVRLGATRMRSAQAAQRGIRAFTHAPNSF